MSYTIMHKFLRKDSLSSIILFTFSFLLNLLNVQANLIPSEKTLERRI